MSWSLDERSDRCVISYSGRELLACTHKGFARSLFKRLNEEVLEIAQEQDSLLSAERRLEELCVHFSLQKAVQWLSCATLSALQIGQKLRKMGLCPKVVDLVIARLKKEGILDEERLKESLIFVAKRKCWSKARLALEAQKKGIDLSSRPYSGELGVSNDASNECSNEAFNDAMQDFLGRHSNALNKSSLNKNALNKSETFESGDENRAARELIEKWKAQMEALPLQKRQQKICARLARRGFSSDLIYSMKEQM